MNLEIEDKQQWSLKIEYKQWLFITFDLYDFIYKQFNLKDNSMKQEIKNVFQHWLLMVNQENNIIKYQYYPILPKIDKSSKDIADILVDAIVEKKFYWRDNYKQSVKFVENIIDFIDKSHNNYQLEDLNPEIFLIGDKIQVGEFRCKYFVNLHYLLSHFRIHDLIKMVLRYESLGNGSYQWGDPRELHLCYYNDYGVLYEGFASPFNSRFISLSGCRFCSLFPDTDTVFGSLGNFFNVDLAQYPGAWSVNPPFLNDVMKRASKKIISALQAGVKSTFFCTYPHWPDSVGWKMLEESKYKLKAFHRTKNIVIQDAYGKVFTPFNGLSLFCLSYYKELNFENIIDILDKHIEDFDTSTNEKFK